MGWYRRRLYPAPTSLESLLRGPAGICDYVYYRVVPGTVGRREMDSSIFNRRWVNTIRSHPRSPPLIPLPSLCLLSQISHPVPRSRRLSPSLSLVPHRPQFSSNRPDSLHLHYSLLDLPFPFLVLSLVNDVCLDELQELVGSLESFLGVEVGGGDDGFGGDGVAVRVKC